MPQQFISKEELKKILENAPEGTSPSGIVASLRKKGVVLEGFQNQEEERVLEEPKNKGFFSRAKTILTKGAQKAIETLPFVDFDEKVSDEEFKEALPGRSVGEFLAAPFVAKQEREAQKQQIDLNTVLERKIRETNDPVKKKKFINMLKQQKTPVFAREDQKINASIQIENTTPAQEAFLTRMQNSFYRRAANVEDIFLATGEKKQSGVEGVFQTLGQGSALIFSDLATETVRSGFRSLPDRAEDTLRAAGRASINKAMQVPGVSQGITKAVEKAGQIERENPRLYRNLAATFHLMDAIGSSAAIYKVTGSGVQGLKNLSKKIRTTGVNVKNQLDDVYKFVWSGTDDVFEAKAKAAGFVKKVDRVEDAIKTRWVNSSVARKKIRKLVDESSPEVRRAFDQGFDIGDANRIAHSTKEELEEAKKMLELVVKQKAGAKGAADHSDIVAKSFLNRVGFLDKKKSEIGKKMGEAIKKLPKNRVVDVPDKEILLLNRIKEVPELSEVTLKVTKSGDNILDFSKTALADDLKAQAEILDVFKKAVAKNPQQMHLFRQKLFNDLGLKSATRVKKIQSIDEKAIQAIRGGMLDAITEVSDDYRLLSEQYAVIESALKPVRKQLSVVGGASEDVLKSRASQLMRRLTSNSGAQIQGQLEQLDLISSLYGFSDNISVAHLQEVSNMIDKYFKVTKSTGFAGQTAQGLNAAGNILRGRSLTGMAAKILEETPLVKNFLPSEEALQVVLENLVQTLLLKAPK